MRRRLPPTVQFPVIPQSTTLRVLIPVSIKQYWSQAMRSIEGESKSMAMSGNPAWIPPKLAYGVQHCDQLGNENLRIITLMRAADTAPAH
eukprot:g5736.t1